jgi:hypothetical protein
MMEEQKKELKIDDIFALFLINISQNLSLKFYKITACFIHSFLGTALIFMDIKLSQESHQSKKKIQSTRIINLT